MIILVSLLVVLLVAIYWNRLHQQHAELKYKFAMFALRDKLRKMAIDGEISPSSVIFDYYDTTLSKNIESSGHLTLFWLYFLYRNHKNSPALEEFHKEIEVGLSAYPGLRYVEAKMIDAIHVYLTDQHVVVLSIIKPIFYLVLGMKVAKGRFRKLVESVLYNPETSGTSKYTVEHVLC